MKYANNQGYKIKLTIAIIGRRAREKDVILLSFSWKRDTQRLDMSKDQTYWYSEGRERKGARGSMNLASCLTAGAI